MLSRDACFVVLKVSDARKGVESHDEGLDLSGPTETSDQQALQQRARWRR